MVMMMNLLICISYLVLFIDNVKTISITSSLSSLSSLSLLSSSSTSISKKLLINGGNIDNDKDKDNDNVKDVIIIGSGPSGCTAAIYTARAMLKPLVIAGYQPGGQLMLTSDVENFPGYRNAIEGPAMMNDLITQATNFGAEFWNINCQSVDLSCYPFKITTYNSTLYTKALILSTGAEALWLGAEREEEFKGKGISTCATCDGYMFRNKPVIVLGGGDSAMEEANFLTRFASSVTIIHRRDTFKASKVMLQRAIDNPKINILTNKKIIRWQGQNGILSGIQIANINSNDETIEDIHCDGAFIAIGHRPNTGFLGKQIELDESGYIILKKHTMTSIPGVFACGDVADTRYKQAITAAGSGCMAAIDVEKWLEDNNTI